MELQAGLQMPPFHAALEKDRTKDNEKREDSGTYPANSSPSAGNAGPENGALLPSSPCQRRRTAPRPRGEGEARAELRSPAPLPSARRQPHKAALLGALRRPGAPKAPGRT
ncbi:uncharacterized protein ACIB01_013523 [Guaruba guarouba]